MAAKKTTPRKSTASKSTARKSTARKSTAKSTGRRTTTASRQSSTATAGLDKSIESSRSSLERSLTLSRERLQEVADDAVKRGRMTRGDANKLVSDLVTRGRRQTDSLLKELE